MPDVNTKKIGPRIEPCGGMHQNIPEKSKKKFSIFSTNFIFNR